MWPWPEDRLTYDTRDLRGLIRGERRSRRRVETGLLALAWLDSLSTDPSGIRSRAPLPGEAVAKSGDAALEALSPRGARGGRSCWHGASATGAPGSWARTCWHPSPTARRDPVGTDWVRENCGAESTLDSMAARPSRSRGQPRSRLDVDHRMRAAGNRPHAPDCLSEPSSPPASQRDEPGSRLGLAGRVGLRRAVQALGPSGSGSGGAGTGGGTSPGAGSGSGGGGAGTGSGSAGGGCTSGCDGSGTLTRAPRSVRAPRNGGPNGWGGSPRAGPHHRRPSGPNRAPARCADPRAARRRRRPRQGRRSR